MVLSAENVLLRPVKPEDLELLAAWMNDESFTSAYNFFNLRRSDSIARRFAEDGMLSARSGTLVATLKNGTVIGDVSYHQQHYGPNDGSLAYNIGISLAAEYRGKGYGVEAQRLLVGYLFATYTIKRIEASTDIENIPEQRALEKAGFTREGVLRQAQWRNGTWHDLVMYSKLRGEP